MFSLHLTTAVFILTTIYVAGDHIDIPDSGLYLYFQMHGDDIELEPGKVLDLQNPIDAETLMSTVYVLCSFYNQCNTTNEVPEHVKSIMGCCLPCDCSDKCFETGNCCMDKKRESMIEEIKEEHCIPANPLDEKDGSDSYLMVVGCASDYQGEAKDKCIVNAPSAIEDFVPVYSQQNGKTYRNIHCTYCNHQNQSLAPWNVSANCDNYSPFYFLDNQKLKLQDKCQLSWKPNGNFKKCFTRDESIDCQKTKYKELCNSVPEGYGYVKELEARVCDGYCGLPSFCPPDPIITKSYQVLLNWAGNTRDEFFVSPVANVGSTETKAICSSRETFSDLEQRCLQITCSPSQMKVGHQKNDCVDLFKMVRGVCADYRMQVAVPFRRTVSAALDEAKLALKGVFQPTFDLFEPEVAGYIVKLDTVVFLVHVVEYMADFVEIRNLYNQFEDMLNNAKTLTPSIKFESAAADQAFEAMALEEIGYVSYWDSPVLSKCRKTIAMNRVQFCEMIMFSPGEFRTNDGGIMLNDGREFKAKDCVFRESRDGELHVQICLDTYRSSESTGNSGGGTTVTGMSSIAMASLCYILLFV